MKDKSPDILTDLGYSREEKRQLIRDIGKRLGRYEFEDRSDLCYSNHSPGWRCGMWASGVFWIQEKHEDRGWLRAMVGRHDKKPGISWPELQAIKQAVYGDRWAVQAYPPQALVTDVANIYWLFIAPNGWWPDWDEVKDF